MAYQGFLTSELAVVKLLLPFNDMNSLSKTDWRLITPIASSSMTRGITESKEGTDFHKVFKNNIDENSFVRKDRRWIEAKKSHKTAVFDIENNIPDHDRCKVLNYLKGSIEIFHLLSSYLQFLIVWRNNIPAWSSSMALQKNSPMTPFLGKSVKQLLDSGLMKRITNKHYRNIGDTSTCDTTPEKSLSLKKLVIRVFLN